MAFTCCGACAWRSFGLEKSIQRMALESNRISAAFKLLCCLVVSRCCWPSATFVTTAAQKMTSQTVSPAIVWPTIGPIPMFQGCVSFFFVFFAGYFSTLVGQFSRAIASSRLANLVALRHHLNQMQENNVMDVIHQ